MESAAYGAYRPRDDQVPKLLAPGGPGLWGCGTGSRPAHALSRGRRVYQGSAPERKRRGALWRAAREPRIKGRQERGRESRGLLQLLGVPGCEGQPEEARGDSINTANQMQKLCSGRSTRPSRQPAFCPWAPTCPAEKVSSLGKDWHRFCLRCEHCSKTLTPGGHAEVSASPRQGGGGEPGQTPALNPCPLPSMMESPSATSPAMPRCLDPKVRLGPPWARPVGTPRPAQTTQVPFSPCLCGPLPPGRTSTLPAFPTAALWGCGPGPPWLKEPSWEVGGG